MLYPHIVQYGAALTLGKGASSYQ